MRCNGLRTTGTLLQARSCRHWCGHTSLVIYFVAGVLRSESHIFELIELIELGFELIFV